MKITSGHRKFVVIFVPANGLALVGARPSAGTVMIKFGSYIYRVPIPDSLYNSLLAHILRGPMMHNTYETGKQMVHSIS